HGVRHVRQPAYPPQPGALQPPRHLGVGDAVAATQCCPRNPGAGGDDPVRPPPEPLGLLAAAAEGWRDGAARLAQLPPVMRLPTLLIRPDADAEVAAILMGIVERGAWDSHDLNRFRTISPICRERNLSVQDVAAMFALWAESESFGERYLSAL